MELQHVNVKMYVEGDVTFDLQRIVEVFHRWVSEQSLPGLWIDVADYRHVPAGPGIVLIGHEADYSFDNTDNRLGLRYNRKHPLAGSNHDRLTQAFHSAADVCRRLEHEFATHGLKFSRREFEMFINDRALAPNTAETRQECVSEIESFLADCLGRSSPNVTVDAADPRKRCRIFIRTTADLDFS
jgi:hypothetical protein